MKASEILETITEARKTLDEREPTCEFCRKRDGISGVILFDEGHIFATICNQCRDEKGL